MHAGEVCVVQSSFVTGRYKIHPQSGIRFIESRHGIDLVRYFIGHTRSMPAPGQCRKITEGSRT